MLITRDTTKADVDEALTHLRAGPIRTGGEQCRVVVIQAHIDALLDVRGGMMRG